MSRESGLVAFSGSFNVLNADGIYDRDSDYDKAIMYSILNEEPEPVTALRTGVPMELKEGSDARAVNAAHLATVADDLLATGLDFDQLLARRDLHGSLLAFDAIHH